MGGIIFSFAGKKSRQRYSFSANREYRIIALQEVQFFKKVALREVQLEASVPRAREIPLLAALATEWWC